MVEVQSLNTKFRLTMESMEAHSTLLIELLIYSQSYHLELFEVETMEFDIEREM